MNTSRLRQHAPSDWVSDGFSEALKYVSISFYVTKYTTGPLRPFYRQSITMLLPSLISIVLNWVYRG